MRRADSKSGGACLAMAVALGVCSLAIPRLAGADAKASAACRGAIAKGMSSLADTGFKAADACHKGANKASTASGQCNDTSNPAFDPSGKYGTAKTKAAALIGLRCPAGEPVRANYDGMDPDMTVGNFVSDGVGGNSTLVEGSMNLGGDKQKIKCLQTVGKSRTSIVKEILKNSTHCQGGKDKTATTFDAIDPTCLDTGAKAKAKAEAKIPAACGSLDGAADLGSCSPLPSCMEDAATNVGQGIAQAIYKKLTVVTCGDGVTQGNEQCDDGANNGTPGDSCNSSCELLTETCGPGTPAGGTIIGHRIITVNLTVPGSQQLAGVQVGFDYPQLEASIKGTGLSSVVQSAFMVLATPPPDGFLSTAYDSDVDAKFVISSIDDFIATGPLVKATLDECVGVSQNLCNRSQEVVGCCPLADIPGCEASGGLNFDKCQCGIVSGVLASDCANASLGPCTSGVCASAPSSAACGTGCTAGGSDKINHPCSTAANCFDTGTCDLGSHLCTAGGSDKINQACSMNADCFDAGACDLGGTNTCTAGEPTKLGMACAANSDCDSAAGACDTGTSTCTAGEPTKIGTACASNPDCDSAAGVCSAGKICSAGAASRIGPDRPIKNDLGAVPAPTTL